MSIQVAVSIYLSGFSAIFGRRFSTVLCGLFAIPQPVAHVTGTREYLVGPEPLELATPCAGRCVAGSPQRALARGMKEQPANRLMSPNTASANESVGDGGIGPNYCPTT
jgi:hypothetical protein